MRVYQAPLFAGFVGAIDTIRFLDLLTASVIVPGPRDRRLSAPGRWLGAPGRASWSYLIHQATTHDSDT